MVSSSKTEAAFLARNDALLFVVYKKEFNI